MRSPSGSPFLGTWVTTTVHRLIKDTAALWVSPEPWLRDLGFGKLYHWESLLPKEEPLGALETCFGSLGETGKGQPRLPHFAVASLWSITTLAVKSSLTLSLPGGQLRMIQEALLEERGNKSGKGSNAIVLLPSLLLREIRIHSPWRTFRYNVK